MADEKRETTVVKSGGGAGWFVAVVLLLVVAFGGFYLYSTGALDGGKDINVTIDVPEGAAPEAPAN